MRNPSSSSSWSVRVATVIALSSCALACKKASPSPSKELDASAASSTSVAPREAAGAASSGAGSNHARPPPRPVDAGALKALPEPPALPLASDALELVAVGKSFTSKILWLQAIGARVWLSGRNLDAYADGDAPLTKGPDLLAKLPYQPGVHEMKVVGAYPHLYAMRTKRIEGRMESPEPTLFVYAPEANGPGTWTPAMPLGMSWYPIAFLAFRGGALIVTSQIEFNAAPSYFPPGPGTSFKVLAPDGSISDPKLSLHPLFMAWGASADGDALSLIGTIATPPKSKDEMHGISGIHVARITSEGTKLVAIQRELGIAQDAYTARVVEGAGAPLVVPPPSLTAESWKPDAMTLFDLDGDKPKARHVSGNESCTVSTATRVGESIYAIRACYGGGALSEVVRVTPENKTEKLVLPRLVKKEGGGFRIASTAAEKATGYGCAATSLVVRGKDDLWISAACGGNGSWDNTAAIPIVLRRGRPQEPVVLP